MAGFEHLVKSLQHAEHTLIKQLAGIRTAISSLQLGSAVSPAMPNRRGPGRSRRDESGGSVEGVVERPRKRRRMSAAARARISAAQKARWAKERSKGSSKK